MWIALFSALTIVAIVLAFELLFWWLVIPDVAFIILVVAFCAVMIALTFFLAYWLGLMVIEKKLGYRPPGKTITTGYLLALATFLFHIVFWPAAFLLPAWFVFNVVYVLTWKRR